MLRWLCRALVILIVAAGGLTAAAPSQAAGPQAPRCFSEVAAITNCIDSRFRAFWEQNGGLAVFGYPITPATPTGAAGTLLVQSFQRARFELHPENAPPYDVLLGRLGADRLAQLGHDPAALTPAAGPIAGCLWFAQTRHNVCDQEGGLGFRTYWLSHGLRDPALTAYQQSVALFGLPLTEARPEHTAGGGLAVTQWFERARFEYYPTNAPPFRVLLGLLGVETLPNGPAAGPGTGIVGQVTIGPNCPGPDTGDPLCEAKPYQATIQVLTPSRTLVQEVQSDAQGAFAVALPPGSYILVPQSTGRWPRAAEQAVTVVAGQVTQVMIAYDTGIRS